MKHAIWNHLKSGDYVVEILNVAADVVVLVNESHDRDVVVVLNAAVAGDVLVTLALFDLENKNQENVVVVFDLLH